MFYPDDSWAFYLRDPEWYRQHNLQVVPHCTAMHSEPMPSGIDEKPP